MKKQVGERVGLAAKSDGRKNGYPEGDIAVDGLDGTNLCATGAPNALAGAGGIHRRRSTARPDLY